VDAVLEDHLASPLEDREKALFTLVSKAARDAASIRREDLDRARESGWSDEALYDAITVCALFSYFNVWIDAAGVHPLPE
jgi:alkylhydroperoxidase family enzyme